MFINRYEQSDVIEDCKVFLNKIKELKPYIVELDEDNIIKPKVHPLDCAVKGNNWRPIIVITHNEYIFSTNDGIQKAWAQKSNTFLRPKGQGQEIMISECFLPYELLNLASLTLEK